MFGVRYDVIFAFALGLVLLWGIGYLLLVPMRWLGRLVINALIGGVVLWVINLVGGQFGFILPVNPLNALAVGLLGVPGVVLVCLLTWLL